MGLGLSVEITRDTPVAVRTTGEIDLCNVVEFSTALDEAFGVSPGGFVIDLTKVEYIDSAGIQAILAAYVKIWETKGRLALVIGNDRIKTVLSVVHLEKLPGVYVYETMDEAISADLDSRA